MFQVVGQDKDKSVKENVGERLELKGRFADGRRYRMVLIESKYRSKLRDDGSFWGTDGGIPQKIISYLSLHINGEEVQFPRKSYGDLCELHTSYTSIELSKKKILIKMEGGDAAGSFRAEFFVEKYKQGYRLSERMIKNGEEPDAIWEKTIYHNDAWNW
jgi:hypothetical protein